MNNSYITSNYFRPPFWYP